jgi:hypothetical protein
VGRDDAESDPEPAQEPDRTGLPRVASRPGAEITAVYLAVTQLRHAVDGLPDLAGDRFHGVRRAMKAAVSGYLESVPSMARTLMPWTCRLLATDAKRAAVWLWSRWNSSVQT